MGWRKREREGGAGKKKKEKDSGTVQGKSIGVTVTPSTAVDSLVTKGDLQTGSIGD